MKRKIQKSLLTGEAALLLQEAGRLLGEARKRRGLTLLALAARAGVDRRTLSQLESGRPGVSIGLFFQVLSLLNLARDFPFSTESGTPLRIDGAGISWTRNSGSL